MWTKPWRGSSRNADRANRELPVVTLAEWLEVRDGPGPGRHRLAAACAGGKAALARSAAARRPLSAHRLSLDSCQPAIRRLCHRLGSRRVDIWSAVVLPLLWHSIRGDRALPDLRPILAGCQTSRRYVLRC